MKTKQKKKELLEQLQKTPVIEIAVAKTGIGRTTFYDWRRDDADFAKAVDDALRSGKELVSDVAEGNLISKIKQGHFQSLVFWLRSHRDEYSNRIEISSQLKHVREELTKEEASLIMKSLEMAGFSAEEIKILVSSMSGENDNK